MRSMSLVVIRRTIALALAGGSLIAAAAHAQTDDPYADSYRAYDQQYGRYTGPPGAYDQDAGPPAYAGGAGYGGYPGYGRYGGSPYGAAQNGYAPYGYGANGSYGSRANAPSYGYNSDSYGQPGYAPPANAAPAYHRDAGDPGYYAPGGMDEDRPPPPPQSGAYGQYGSQSYGDQDYSGPPSSGYPLPPN